MRKPVIFRTDCNGPIRVLSTKRPVCPFTPGSARGAVLFDCGSRKLQVEVGALEKPNIATLGAIPAAGFHTYGESWPGHMNHTLTGLVFG